jgi:hypothetical protein
MANLVVFLEMLLYICTVVEVWAKLLCQRYYLSQSSTLDVYLTPMLHELMHQTLVFKLSLVPNYYNKRPNKRTMYIQEF